MKACKMILNIRNDRYFNMYFLSNNHYRNSKNLPEPTRSTKLYLNRVDFVSWYMIYGYLRTF